MTAAATRTPDPQPPPRAREGEWFWRFLAIVMLAVVGWVVWIAMQISPPDMILPAAYEAAAKARATHNTAGVIGGAPAQGSIGATQSSASEVTPHVPPNTPPLDPPVNVEKLKVEDSIKTPIVERTGRAGKQAAGAVK